MQKKLNGIMADYSTIIYLKAVCTSPENTIANEDEPKCEINKNTKKIKTYEAPLQSTKKIESHKKLLEEFSNAVLKKMDTIEERLDILSQNSNILSEKIDLLSNCTLDNSHLLFTANMVPLNLKATEITLNRKEDFPEGSWLGYENNPTMRVRCKISPKDLQKISKKCLTAEKMALALLDLLFDRETQACSNISGIGKHKKKRLDPLMIYGIKCHLIYNFDITEDEWNKVKIHIDSKCRTAFRRKLKGMSLTPRKHVPSDSFHSIASKTPQNSNTSYIEKDMNCYGLSSQNEDDANKNTLETLMQIIVSEQ